MLISPQTCLSIYGGTRSGIDPTYYLSYPGQVARYDASIGGLTLVDGVVSAWAPVTAGDSITTGVADPDGGTGAISLVESATAATHYIDGTETTQTNCPAYVRDVFIKAEARENVVIYYATSCQFALNLTTGVGSQLAGSGGTCTCVDVGNGWKRLVITIPTTGANVATMRIYASTTSPASTNSYTGGSAAAFSLYQRGTASWQQFVQAWADQSGNGHHLSQATATRMMSAIGALGVPATVGGYATPYVQAALSSGKGLENGVAASRTALAILHSGVGCTMIIAGIAGVQHNATNRTLVGTATAVAGSYVGMMIYAPNISDGSLALRSGNGSGDVITAGTAIGSLTAGQGYVIGYRMSTAHGWSVRNGATMYSGTLSAVPVTTPATAAFRFGLSAAAGVDCYPAFGMVINNVVSDADLLALMKSVNARFSLGVTL